MAVLITCITSRYYAGDVIEIRHCKKLGRGDEMNIKLPKRYANLAEIMMYENQALADAGWDPVELPHGAVDIEQAWKVWVLEEGLTVNGYSVPPYFMTDFASIPKMLRWLYDPVGAPWQVAAVLHDYLYSTAPYVSRAEADLLYFRVSRFMGTPYVSAVAQYVALRLGGWVAWRSNRKRLATEGDRWRFLASDWRDWARESGL